MKLSRPRFTVRLLMMAVLIVAAAIEAEVIRRNRAFCQARTLLHSRMAENERNSSRMAEDRVLHPANETETGMFRYIARTRTERANWHEVLREKWERGASHPWERVAPDPPSPENYGPIDFARPTYSPSNQAGVPVTAEGRN